MICPKCYSDNFITFSKKQKRYQCKSCNHIFNERRGTKAYLEKAVVSDNTLESGYTREITSKGIVSLEDILSYCNVDTNLWEVESVWVNKWPTTSFDSKTTRTVDDTGGFTEVITKDPVFANNIQVKVKLQKLTNIKDWAWFREDFMKGMEKKSVKVPVIKYKKPKSDFLRNMKILNLYDLHLGKLGWSPETRDGNYDYRIAKERFHAAIDTLIMRASTYDIEQIVVPWGHDFFNSDIEGTGSAITTAGTAQQNDVRWQKMWMVGRELSLEMVEKLKVLAPVKIIVVPGNHDTQKMFYLGDLLYCVYKNDPNVTVDNAPSRRKYHRYGNTLLGFTHAVGGRAYPPENRLLSLMPAEKDSRYDFAETQFHEWHVGHTHHRSKGSQMDFKDHQGIAIRVMASLSAADAWHADMGYTGAVKGADALIYNYVTGPDAHFTYNLVL